MPNEGEKMGETSHGFRRALPPRRNAETFKLRFGDQRAAYHVTLGYYDGGDLGEVFISTNSVGSSVDAMARDLAVLMSLALQHGCKLETMRSAVTRESDGKPSTIAGAVIDHVATTVSSLTLHTQNVTAHLSWRKRVLQMALDTLAQVMKEEAKP
jgi:hypothetical protein